MPLDPTPTLYRTLDAERLNALANHPQIRPMFDDDGKSFLDTTPFVANQKNHAVMWDKGAFLFTWTAPQTYEVHIMVLPEGRGRAAYRKASQGIAYMLEQGMDRLWARISKNARGLRHYTRAAGFTHCGEDAIDYGSGPVLYDIYQWKKPCPSR